MKDEADQHKTCTGVDLTCDQHSSLILSAASSYDIKHISAHGKVSRRVYESNIDDSNCAEDCQTLIEDIDIEDCDIDAAASTLLANLTKSYSNSDGYLPPENFRALTPEVKTLWNKVPSDMRAMILRGCEKGDISFDCNTKNNHNSKFKSSYKPKPSYSSPPSSST